MGEEVRLLHLFESIRDQAKEILDEIGELRSFYVRSIGPSLYVIEKDIREKVNESMKIIGEYNLQYQKVNALGFDLQPVFSDLGRAKDAYGEAVGSLRLVIARCNSVTRFLRNTISPISSEQADKLQSLRKELGSFSIDIPEIELSIKNLTEAVDEFESGHFLASALIASRVVAYTLSKIKGKNDDEKIRSLIDCGAIPKDRKDIHTSLIKTSRRARNYLSHSIYIFPEPSDSLSSLGDSIGLLRYYFHSIA